MKPHPIIIGAEMADGPDRSVTLRFDSNGNLTLEEPDPIIAEVCRAMVEREIQRIRVTAINYIATTTNANVGAVSLASIEDSIAEMQFTNLTARWWLVGDGVYRQLIKQHAETSMLRDQIEMRGMVFAAERQLAEYLGYGWSSYSAYRRGDPPVAKIG